MIHWQASISLSTLANMPALEGHLKSLSTAAPVNDEPQNRIFLWTAPRCISTAFERSVMEVGGGKLFHEPYTSSYYFGPERISRYCTKCPHSTSLFDRPFALVSPPGKLSRRLRRQHRL